MVNVLAIGTKVCRLKPGQGNGFIRAIRICSTPSFGEVKTSAPYHKILWHIKTTLKYEQIFHRPNLSFPSPSFS
jgi:hypothetical protein